LSTRQNVSGK